MGCRRRVFQPWATMRTIPVMNRRNDRNKSQAIGRDSYNALFDKGYKYKSEPRERSRGIGTAGDKSQRRRRRAQWHEIPRVALFGTKLITNAIANGEFSG
jgi:hypothetical protein